MVWRVKEKEKKNHAGKGNSPYINYGKGFMLARKSREPPPPESKREASVGLVAHQWWVSGSMRPQGT
eukprot:1145668-Pelagomonas_calceolata.AAC.2